jgi:hypothetical protein
MASLGWKGLSSHDGITELYSLIVDFFHCVMYSNYKKLASVFRLAAETAYYHIIINNVL